MTYILEKQDIKDLMEDIPEDTISSLFAKEFPDRKLKNYPKAAQIKKICEEIQQAGIKLITDQFNIQELLNILDKKIKENEKLPDDKKLRYTKTSRLVLRKRLRDLMSNDGIELTLKDLVANDLLTGICVAMDVPEDSIPEDRAELITKAHEAILSQGMALYFSSLPVQKLQEIARGMRIGGYLNSKSKQNLIWGIMSGEPVPKKTVVQVQREVGEPSKHKPAKIKRGISEADLMYHYKVQELVEFAKNNKMITTGRKAILVKRILDWLGGDKENTVPKAERKARRRKEREQLKRGTKRKDSPRKERDEPAKKPKDDDEEEEEVEVEMDLDDLPKLTLQELKDYAAEEQIKVKGKTKDDYVAAIQKHHEAESD